MYFVHVPIPQTSICATFLRLLTEKPSVVISEVEHLLDELQPLEDNAALNYVNALEDLLWAFELRATASWVFQAAIKKNIYQHNVFRSILYFSLILLSCLIVSIRYS